MSRVEDIVVERLERLKFDIQKKMEEEGENATYRTSSSFVVEKYDEGVRLVMGGENTAPLETLEIGSPPHYVPILALQEWINAKGINLNAYAVQRKILREGTNRYTNNVDIYTTLTSDALNELAEQLPQAIFESDINTLF